MADKQYIGTREVDFIEEKARQVGNLPGIRDILSFAGGVAKFADEAFIDPHRYASEQGEVGFSGALGTVIRGGEFIMDKASEGGGIIAENLGVDPRIGQFVAGAAADTVLSAGVGAAGKKAMQAVDMLTPPPGGGLALAGAGDGLVTRGGQVRLNPNVNQITIQNPDFLAPGMQKGVAKTSRYKQGLAIIKEEAAKIEADRAKALKRLKSGELTEDQYKRRLQKLKKREDARLSTLALPDDPDIFEKDRFRNLDPTQQGKLADQHHAAAKAMTAPWVKQALRLGDDDDIVAFFEFHRMLTGSGMGNAKSGIIDMPDFTHNTAKARNAKELSETVHSFMKKSGADIEILGPRIEKMIGNPKNMDELMEKYFVFAQEYLIPQKELALKRLQKALSEHRSTLKTPQERAAFDNLVDKLNKANTP